MHKDQTDQVLPIGGFFELEPPGGGGLADLWHLRPDLAWENVSSAFAALVGQLRPGAVWMPGYLCAHMAAAVPDHLRRFFPLTKAMDPDLNAFGALQDGDLVLAVNYFGRAPAPEWREFVANRPQVTFVEDCAQTLDPGAPPWGDWRLFSPRKLMGVPEGGLLVPVSAKARDVAGPTEPSDPERARQRLVPMQLRRAHPADNSLWHPLHQAAENAGSVNGRAMHPKALRLLTSIDPAPMIAARKANFAHLARRLVVHAMITDPDPGFAPFGFPVLLPAARRDDILARIHASKVFPTVHWRAIAAPPDFAADHLRAARIATLPCDHRYGLDQMNRVADVFLEALA